MYENEQKGEGGEPTLFPSDWLEQTTTPVPWARPCTFSNRFFCSTFMQKLHKKNCDGTTPTQPDKGSAEPLSRNMLGSHSSLDDKNPDVIPQEPNSDDEFLSEEKAFERLNSEKILYGHALNLSTATTIMEPPSPTHATLKSILNSATLQRTHSTQNKNKVSHPGGSLIWKPPLGPVLYSTRMFNFLSLSPFSAF